MDKLFPTLRHLLDNSLVTKELPNVLINIQAGHVEQDSGIDPVLLRHLGIVLVEDLLEDGERYLHIGLESCKPLLLALPLKVPFTCASKSVSAGLSWPRQNVKY